MLHYWKHLNKVDKLSFVFGEDSGTQSWVTLEWLKYKQMVVWLQVIEDEDIILKRERVNVVLRDISPIIKTEDD